MKLLVLDSNLAAGIAITRDLNKDKRLACQATYVSSTAEALGRLELERDAIGIIVFFLEQGPEAGLAFIREIRDFTDSAFLRCPRFVALVPGDLQDGYSSRFVDLGADCLAYGNPTELHFTLRRLMFDARREKGRPTIIVERRGKHTRFYLLGPAGRVPIPYGPRLIRTMNHLAISFSTCVSTAELAEAGEISEGSVKKYMQRLIAGYDEARLKAGISVPGREVFRTLRKDGGFVHFLKARVIFV